MKRITTILLLLLLTLSLTACGQKEAVATPDPSAPASPTSVDETGNKDIYDLIKKYQVNDQYDLIGYMEEFGYTYHSSAYSINVSSVEEAGQIVDNRLIFTSNRNDFDDLEYSVTIGYGMMDESEVRIVVQTQKGQWISAIDFDETEEGADLNLTGELYNKPPVNSEHLFKMLAFMPDIVESFDNGRCPFENSHELKHGPSNEKGIVQSAEDWHYWDSTKNCH